MTVPKRRWLRCSLWTMFVVVTTFGCYLGLLTYHARQQILAIRAVKAVGGYYYYDYQCDPPNSWYHDQEVPPGPTWLWKVISKDAFFDVVAVGLNSKPASDETVIEVCRLARLQVLDLAGATNVTDMSLIPLARMNHLTYLRLDGTSVSESAAIKYREDHRSVELTWFPEPTTAELGGTSP